jgi:MoaA/NifB/PqqE/SkfB family radical SAM enzyme
MCPFGDSNKEGQLKLVNERDLTTEQWKSIFDKVSKYCVWSIIEGGEPTSRPDFMDLVSYLHSINLPTSLITNCSLLHTVDLEMLRRYIQFITCSIDSVYDEPYCKVRGVSSKTFNKVMENIELLNQSNISHYFNSVITKFNTDEFIDQSYFDKANELGSSSVSLTFVEDRADVSYSLLPDRKTMVKVCESILDYGKKKIFPSNNDTPGVF